MPPAEAHRTLKPEQVALLRQWVKEGAVYQEHWAFIAPKRPPGLYNARCRKRRIATGREVRLTDSF